ncbi:peptide deformylase, mitochondrial-like [Epargyreus clarus]|uniref:peptide deformylase, mitochondrial-like n=1 Tax=Epargyreus clarus TaxID=520877 RepID=UPI003C2F69D8
MGVLRKTLNWYARLSPKHGASAPPFSHVVQIGDPTLRTVSHTVPIEKIKGEVVQNVIKKLQDVLFRYGSVGMSAPQIGINLRIFAMRHTAEQIASVQPEVAKMKGMSVVPYTVFVNPVLKVIDYQKVIHTEGCESVRSFAADVARYRAVEVSGWNAEGEPQSQVYTGWPARIVQHEIDHLDGKLYTDIMDRKTLHCTCWDEVNLSKGKVAIPFAPESV